jgi:hypothetical protein
MDAIKSDQNSRIAVRILVSDTVLTSRKIDGEIRLAKIPAMIALRYLAEALKLYLTSDGIIWTLREKLDGPDDMVTRTYPKITAVELRKMGLVLKTDGTITPISGPVWPSDPASRAAATDHTLFLMAWDRDIETFDALLLLIRRGYRVPTINSEQDGGDNALEPPSHPSTAPTKTRATP